MGMRIVWALFDNERDGIVCLFEAENLLVDYRDQLLRSWFDEATRPLNEDFVGTAEAKMVYDALTAERERLLALGYERWRNDEINSRYPRYLTQKYEIWNSVPPNPQRLVLHFDS